MIPQTLFSTLLAAIIVSAAPFSQRRDLSTIIDQCNHDFAYTWDDGPYIYHREIVKAFNNVSGKTSFFMNGDNWSCIYEESNVQNMRIAYEAGHMAASHTWSHADLTTLTYAQIDEQIQRLDEAFIKILGVRPKFLRPPYGNMNDTVATYIQSKYGKTIVTWSDDSGDSTGGTAQESYDFYKAFADAGPGKPHMTLSHETDPAGIGALRMGTVPLLANAGIKLLTVAQCLDMDPYDQVGAYGHRDSSWYCGGTWTPPNPSCVATYDSASGDTCVSIGSKYGLTGSAISQANTSIDCSDIQAGTAVCIPSPGTPCGQSYTSQVGDSCATVANQFGVTSAQIQLWNYWVNCDNIWTGTVLCVKH